MKLQWVGHFLLLAVSLTKPLILTAQSNQEVAASRAEIKIQHIGKNGELAHPDAAATELTENEINAYFASGRVKLPDGVQSVTFEGRRGVVTSYCRVNFDEVKEGRRSANPLLSLFSGVHDVVVIANAHGADGTGVVEIQSVMLDGAEIPRFVLDLFIAKFLQPSYPNLGMDSRFALPDKIDAAIVGAHSLTITQK
jgi:hypothetical protein